MVEIRIVTDSDLTVFSTVMQAVYEGYKKELGIVNRRAIDLVSAKAEQNFANSILREGTSKTLGGRTYRKGSRVTGRFTFGKGKTFTGSLLKNLGPNITGFGYPIVNRADQRTKRVWRGLEFGWDSMRMPKGIWRDAQGDRIGATGDAAEVGKLLGGDVFTPRRSSLSEEVAGIAPKQFIADAFEWVVTNYLEPEYQKKAVEVAKRESDRGG